MSKLLLRVPICFVLLLVLLQPYVGLAAGDLSLKTGAGVAVQSDGNYSPMVDFSAGYEKWSLNANLSGYSESKTKVSHILTGVLYSVPVTSGDELQAEFGLGGIIAQTNAANKTERMITYTFPVGLNWTVLNLSGFVVEANWKSWVFSPHAYLPLLGLVSHDRFTTLALSAGVSL